MLHGASSRWWDVGCCLCAECQTFSGVNCNNPLFECGTLDPFLDDQHFRCERLLHMFQGEALPANDRWQMDQLTPEAVFGSGLPGAVLEADMSEECLRPVIIYM